MNTVPQPRFPASEALFAEVKANAERLAACKRHRVELGDPPYKFGMTVTCIGCGGTMKAVDLFRYVQGFEAAGGNPNDVVPGYNPDWKPQSEEQKEGVLQMQYCNTVEAHNRIYDLLLGDDPQAIKEGRAYLQREAPELAAKLAVVNPERTFADAWQVFKDAGYDYGKDALQQVGFGWNIAHGAKPYPFKP